MRKFDCMVLLTSALLAAGSQAARAEVEFSVGVGYGHVSLDGSGGVFNERDGLRLEPRVSFNPVDAGAAAPPWLRPWHLRLQPRRGR